MIVRRIGEYAFVRPGREMLFAPLDAESKYKAKNVIATVVYRAGDAVSDFEVVLAKCMLAAPAFTLRGGTNEILRNVIARSLGLR
jgi:ATP/ADP translocase